MRCAYKVDENVLTITELKFSSLSKRDLLVNTLCNLLLDVCILVTVYAHIHDYAKQLGQYTQCHTYSALKEKSVIVAELVLVN